MPASPPLALVMRVVMVRTLTVPQPPHHLVVLVAQHPRQKERGLVCAPGFKASPRPSFAIYGNIPLLFDAGTTLVVADTSSSWGQRLLCGMVAGCVGVVSQLVDALHKLTLFIEHFLVKQGEGVSHNHQQIAHS